MRDGKRNIGKRLWGGSEECWKTPPDRKERAALEVVLTISRPNGQLQDTELRPDLGLVFLLVAVNKPLRVFSVLIHGYIPVLLLLRLDSPPCDYVVTRIADTA